jgi:hypothetical protein
LRACGHKINFAANQRLYGLIGWNVREIDLDAVLPK